MLILHHPEVAGRSCTDCKAWVYEDTGDKMGAGRAMRGGKPVPRPPGSKTPCHKCPKESPEKAKEHELSPKNQQAYLYYLQVRHTFGRCMSKREAADPIIAANMAMLGSIVEHAEQSQLVAASMMRGRR